MTTEQRFEHALEQLITRIQGDHSILAAILCGSLSHDAVWDQSDIDLTLVTIDDQKIEASDISVNSAGVNVHICLMPRAAFRRTAEGATRNSFIHSMLAKGRLLYTHDDTITELCDRLRGIGERDTQLQLLSAGAAAIRSIDKAHKWFVTRGDLDYTGLWILYAANALARVEVLSARQLAGREVLPQAMQLNPAFFTIVYTQMLNTRKTRKNVKAALDAIDAYLHSHAPDIFRPILDYLRDTGETRSASELETHFTRNFNIEGTTTVCEYLAEQHFITKVSLPVRLTRRSKISVEELAFVHTGAAAAHDEF